MFISSHLIIFLIINIYINEQWMNKSGQHLQFLVRPASLSARLEIFASESLSDRSIASIAQLTGSLL